MKTFATANRRLRAFAATLLSALSIISGTLTLSGAAQAGGSSTQGSQEECRNAEENSLC